jgi:hypothetical protein
VQNGECIDSAVRQRPRRLELWMCMATAESTAYERLRTMRLYFGGCHPALRNSASTSLAPFGLQMAPASDRQPRCCGHYGSTARSVASGAAAVEVHTWPAHRQRR